MSVEPPEVSRAPKTPHVEKDLHTVQYVLKPQIQHHLKRRHGYDSTVVQTNRTTAILSLKSQKYSNK